MEALRETNKFLQEKEPWMRKADEDRPYRLECVRVCLEAVYCVSHLLVAFLPTACTRVFEKLGESRKGSRQRRQTKPRDRESRGKGKELRQRRR